jgi:hypothetical protein
MNQNANIKIRSYNKFKFTCNNHYEGEWVQIPGSPNKTFRQEPADCKHQEWPVYQVEIPISEQYIDHIYEAHVNPVKGYTFFEDPYLREGPALYDNNKKLNYHFSKFKKGDQVPLEYIFWQWVHKHKDDIRHNKYSIIVNKYNFHTVQWLLQALYNDTLQEFSTLELPVVESIYYNLKGDKTLIKMPTDYASSVVGEFDILASNSEFLEAKIQEMEKELQARKELLENAKQFKGSVQSTTIGTVADNTGFTTPSIPNESLNTIAELLVDNEDVAALVNKAIDIGVLQKAGAYFKLPEFGDKNFGPGIPKAITTFTENKEAREVLKEALSKKQVIV